MLHGNFLNPLAIDGDTFAHLEIDGDSTVHRWISMGIWTGLLLNIFVVFHQKISLRGEAVLRKDL